MVRENATVIPSVLLERGVSVYTRREPRSFFGDHDTKAGRMFDKNGQLLKIGRCFIEGIGIRATARRVGCARDTVAKFYKILRANGREFRCACGNHLAHRGNCIARDTPRIRTPANPDCPRGHPYKGGNLKRRLNGTRRCRQCRLESDRASRRRRAAKMSGCASVVLAVDLSVAVTNRSGS